jgi:predicted DNA-binding protein YlxM (UPF0122 family)
VRFEKKRKGVADAGQLTRRQEEGIFLRYFEDLNFHQIAAVMNVSKQAVYNLISIALDELKTYSNEKTALRRAFNSRLSHR